MTKLFNGDCLNEMKQLEDNSVDTIITDPPYGLSFMGKKWDYDVPKVDVWQECLRVLKPGGTALIFAGSRTQHRMAVNVEDAGFILKDTIMWLYGSGFPKATDISKQLDKMAGAEREVVGEYKMPSDSDAGNAGKGTINRGDGGQFTAGKNVAITAPSTDQAKQWNGWKSHGLKPAYEPILVAMKPNEGTYAKNAIKWGVSGLNIDGGRIETSDKLQILKNDGNKNIFDNSRKKAVSKGKKIEFIDSGLGRFPANIILDEVAGQMLDEQSGVTKSIEAKRGNGIGDGYHGSDTDYNTKRGHNDKGGASRFFYCAKASKKERNAGCEGLPMKEKAQLAGANNSKPIEELDDVSKRYRSQPMSNVHPTVKPIKLMEYLCTLTKTPTGGVVLDPFMGSGSTGVACKNTNREFIGIEMDAEYFKIAKARCI